MLVLEQYFSASVEVKAPWKRLWKDVKLHRPNLSTGGALEEGGAPNCQCFKQQTAGGGP